MTNPSAIMWVFVVVLLLNGWTIGHVYGSVRLPIMFVPGLGGSRLQADVGAVAYPEELQHCPRNLPEPIDVWINLALTDLSPLRDCWEYWMSLTWQADGKVVGPQGVTIQEAGFGNLSGVNFMIPDFGFLSGYFDTFSAALELRGYVDGVDLAAATYDWRLAPSQLAQNGAMGKWIGLVEFLYAKAGGHRVVILAHSSGSTNALYFLQTQVSSAWKAKYIAGFATMGGPWGGTVNSIEGFLRGDNFGLPFANRWPMQGMERTFGSVLAMFPQKYAFGTEPIVACCSKSYDTANLTLYGAGFSDMLSVLKLVHAPVSLENALQSVINDTSLHPEPGVPLLCMYGTDTWVSGPLLLPNTSQSGLNGLVEMYFHQGDGAVPLQSLQLCAEWPNAKVLTFPGVQHIPMIHNQTVIESFMEFVNSLAEAQ